MMTADVLLSAHLRRTGVQIAATVQVQLFALDGVCFGPYRLWWIAVLLSGGIWWSRLARHLSSDTTPREYIAARNAFALVGGGLFLLTAGCSGWVHGHG